MLSALLGKAEVKLDRQKKLKEFILQQNDGLLLSLIFHSWDKKIIHKKNFCHTLTLYGQIK